MNTFLGKLLAVVLCGGMIYRESHRGYFAQLARYVRQDDKRRTMAMLGAAAVLASLVFLMDLRLQAAVQGIQASLVVALIHVGGWLGQGTALWLILVAIYALARLLRHPAVQAAAFGCAVSAALAAVLSSILKWSVARARPNAQLGPLAFFQWSQVGRSRFQSFPSGDTVIVAAAAWYLWCRYPKVPLGARLLLLVLPLATACSRVLLNKHWPSDTVFAIGLGFVSAQWVARYEAFGVRQPQA